MYVYQFIRKTPLFVATVSSTVYRYFIRRINNGHTYRTHIRSIVAFQLLKYSPWTPTVDAITLFRHFNKQYISFNKFQTHTIDIYSIK